MRIGAGIGLAWYGLFAVGAPAFAQCPGHWDPAVSALGVLNSPSAISDIALLPSGDVAVAGSFETVNGAASRKLALYHPASNTWTAVGLPALYGDIFRIVASPDGTLVTAAWSNQLHRQELLRVDLSTGAAAPFPPVADSLLPVESVPASVTVGANGDILMIGEVQDDGSLVYRFDQATNVWVRLGDEIRLGAGSLVSLPDGRIAVATNEFGHPSYPNTTTSVNVWTPSSGSWSTVYFFDDAFHTDLRSNVWALLALPNGDLIAGGSFTTIPGVSTPNVARYRPQSGAWSSIANGLPARVTRLVATTAGAGTPTLVAGTANGMFRYQDGTSGWSQLRPTLVANVMNTIALPGGDLLVAGYDGVTANPTPVLARYSFSPGTPFCAADFDCSGTLAVQDIFEFLGAWFGGDPRADLNGAGLGASDIFAFLATWFAGC